MKIQEIEPTPNPNAMKFVVDQRITTGFVTHSFEDAEAAQQVPLARKIFEIDHVISVYFADRWITVTQDGQADWAELLREIAEPIREATPEDINAEVGAKGDSASGALRGEDEEIPGLDDPRMERIEAIIESEILPFLQGDGGGLKIEGLVDDELMIRYEGACGTCPASMTGTLMAIENLLQVEVDEQLTVTSIEGGVGGGMGGGLGGIPPIF